MCPPHVSNRACRVESKLLDNENIQMHEEESRLFPYFVKFNVSYLTLQIFVSM